MEYVLICLLPVCMAAGALIALKGVQVGLRWQMQTKDGVKPTLEVKKPTAPAKQGLTDEIFAEWTEGAKEKRD